MNGPELQALRRLLFFTTAEAARRIAADDQRPDGVEERTWSRWESGQRPIPENIAGAVLALVRWRAAELARLRQELQRAVGGALVLPWPIEAEDWTRGRATWRPYQSAVAQLLAEAPDQVRLAGGELQGLPTV